MTTPPEPKAEPVKYGFYSPSAESHCGSLFYLTPSGTKVVVTCVSPDRQAPDYVWPDKVFVGEVAQFAGVALKDPRRPMQYPIMPDGWWRA